MEKRKVGNSGLEISPLVFGYGLFIIRSGFRISNLLWVHSREHRPAFSWRAYIGKHNRSLVVGNHIRPHLTDELRQYLSIVNVGVRS